MDFAPLEKRGGRYKMQVVKDRMERQASHPTFRMEPNESGANTVTCSSPNTSERLSTPFSKHVMLQRSDALRSKLINVGDKLVGFDHVVEEEAHRRRLLEEQRLAELMDAAAILERNICDEIRQRVESHETLQLLTERFANEMLDDLQRKLLHRMEKLTCAIETLTFRCQALENGIQQFKGELPSKLQVDTMALMDAIHALSSEMEQNKKLRLERDQDFAKRLGEVEFTVDQKAEHALLLFDNELDQVSHVIEAQDDKSNFRAFLMEELHTLKDGLSLAHHAREQADDEIVVAINQYTTVLQRGLRKSL